MWRTYILVNHFIYLVAFLGQFTLRLVYITNGTSFLTMCGLGLLLGNAMHCFDAHALFLCDLIQKTRSIVHQFSCPIISLTGTSKEFIIMC